MNFKRKKNRFQGRIPLNCKYWYKGMAKTNYRKQPKGKRESFEETVRKDANQA